MDIKQFVKDALQNKKSISTTVDTSDTWKLTMFLEFNGGRPDIYFIASFQYKNGRHGAEAFRFEYTNGKFLLWRKGVLKIPQNLLQKALDITKLAYESTNLAQSAVIDYEAIAYTVQNIVKNKVDIGTFKSLNEFKKDSLDKLAVPKDNRHKLSFRDCITGMIHNGRLDVIVQHIKDGKSIPQELRQKCLDIFRDVRKNQNQLVACAHTLHKYCLERADQIEYKPIGYLLEVESNEEVDLYDNRVSLCGRIKPNTKEDGSVYLNKISTIIFMSQKEYTGELTNAQLKAVNLSTNSNADYINSISIPYTNVMQNIDLLDILDRVNIHHFIPMMDYLHIIADAVRK